MIFRPHFDPYCDVLSNDLVPSRCAEAIQTVRFSTPNERYSARACVIDEQGPPSRATGSSIDPENTT